MLYFLRLRKLPKEGSCPRKDFRRLKKLTPCSYGNVEMGGNTHVPPISHFLDLLNLSFAATSAQISLKEKRKA